MSDEEALLAAIIAAPDDDLPRLVYADWLDEHSGSLPLREREAATARAEFIRVQIERARLSTDDGRYQELLAREAKLLKRYKKPWGQQVRELFPECELEFRRGFVAAVTTDTRHISNVHRLAGQPLVEEVRVRDCYGIGDGLGELGRPLGVRIRALLTRSPADQSRYCLDLLRQSPPRIEPFLLRGRWLVYVWAVRSGPSQGILHRLVELVRTAGSQLPLTIGVRPYHDEHDFSAWCPVPPAPNPPHWLLFEEGAVVGYQAGPAAPRDWLGSPLPELPQGPRPGLFPRPMF